MGSERKSGEVDVSSGEDNSQFGRHTVGTRRQVEIGNGSRPKKWSNGYRATRLNDDFHAFPDQPHRSDDLFFAYEKDAVKMTPQDRKRPRGQRSAQAIGDGVAGIERL